MHLYCRFYLETDSDSYLHCRFYLKTGSDVHTPLYKTNCRPHTSIPPTHELIVSYFSRFTLTSQEIHSLYVIWSWLLHFSLVLICCLLQYSIYIHLIYIYIHFSLHSTFIYIIIPCIRSMFNYVAIFYLEEFFVHIFYVHIFLHFIDQVVWTTDLPHHKNQVSTLTMSHWLLMWSFHGSLFQLLYGIFFNIFLFFMLTNKCN